MAPLNGAAGKPATTVARRAASKPVVPVLPLYPQRPPVTKPTPSPSVSSSSAPTHPNGQILQDKTDNYNHNTCREPVVEVRREGGQSSVENRDAAVTSAVAPVQTVSAPGPAAPAIATSTEKVTATPTATTVVPDQPLASPTPTRPPAPPTTTFNNMRISELAHDPSAPVFQPNMVNRPTFHQPRASNGSLIFGQLHDSNASSPAPHSGGSFLPPPPGIMPYPAVTRSMAVDLYGRPVMVSPTLDGYPPALVNHHGPPTPHSFHGSQSSVPAEETSLSSYPSVNGHNGFPVDQPHHGPSRGMNHHVDALHLNPPPGYSNLREQDETLAFLRHAVADNSFTDCTLEVRFSNTPQQWDHPESRQLQPIFRAPAHRFVLSRSPMLNALMKSLGTPAGGVVYLTPHDEYMRPDVFNFTFRSLYGWSLGDGILPTELRPRDVRDDMKTTLSYIATARYLQLGSVFSTAVQRAARLLCWDTIELAIAFVLPIVTLSHRGEAFNLSELLNQHILPFIVNNFPKDFVFDVNAADTGFTRLPKASIPPHNPNAPPIAHGTPAASHSRQSSTGQPHPSLSHRLGSNLRSAQIKQLQFGDISLPDQNGYESASPTEPAGFRRPPTPNEMLLSRILLNLPFELLKQVLEHPHLGNQPELAYPARHKIITDIVAERESRRLASLEKTNPQFEVFRQALEKAVGPLVVGQLGDFYVNNMGFREEVFSGDGPYLARTWTRGAAEAVSA